MRINPINFVYSQNIQRQKSMNYSTLPAMKCDSVSFTSLKTSQKK